jgi:hypothetical protein
MDFLLYIGIVFILFGGIYFVIIAFKKSLLWGIGCILIYPISLIFLIIYWKETKKTFLIQLIGIGIIIISDLSSYKLY